MRLLELIWKGIRRVSLANLPSAERIKSAESDVERRHHEFFDNRELAAVPVAVWECGQIGPGSSTTTELAHLPSESITDNALRALKMGVSFPSLPRWMPSTQVLDFPKLRMTENLRSNEGPC